MKTPREIYDEKYAELEKQLEASILSDHDTIARWRIHGISCLAVSEEAYLRGYESATRDLSQTACSESA